MSSVHLLASIIAAAAATNVTSSEGTHCTARGGCDCDCSWAKPSTCGHDDGSCCYACCCGHGPSPGPSPRRRRGPSPRRRRGPSPGPSPPGPSPGGSAGTTRYWDCSGGACGGGDAVHCPNPQCRFPWGTPKCMPHSAAPRRISHPSGATVYATAAAGDPIWRGGAACGKCYLLRSPAGGKMIVRVNNQCPGNSNPSCRAPHFDIAVPGFDYGPASASNVCQTAPRNCDPGVNSGVCSHGPISFCDCSKVGGDSKLQNGCRVFKGLAWGDNPTVSMQPIGCPWGNHFIDENVTLV